MGNLLQLINKSETLENKAKLIVKDTLYDLKRGNISNANELLYRVYVCMKSFYESIGKPTMKKRLALDSPSSKDYNETMKEVKNDIVTINDECNVLNEILAQMYTQMEVDRVAIDNMLTNAFKSSDKASFMIDNINCSSVFIDSFTSSNYFDMNACTKEPAFIDTTYQYISLNTSSLKTTNNKASIEILDGSNGFLGNTHQVKLVNNEIVFLGSENLRMNLADTLDSVSDTWIEYEVFKVSDDTLISTLGLGFDYDEDIKWITNEDKLLLQVAMKFDKAEQVNTFSISPYLAAEKGALPSLITSIIVSDNKGTVTEIIEEAEIFDEVKVYTFPKQYCKEVTVTLEQDTSYMTTAGHLYYKEVPNSNRDYYKTHESSYNNRIDGDMPSVSNVGIVYDDKARRFIQPKSSYGKEFENESLIKTQLFELPDEQSLKQAYFEALEAERFLIGIRDLSLTNYTYTSVSEYVSVNYTSDKPISVVSLDASEDIPENFGADKDWIRYSFSLNDGTDWHQIIPNGLYKKDGYMKYLINSGTPSEFRDDNIGYIETPDDNYNIKLKIELERPTGQNDMEYYTPIVYEYKLQL